MAASFTLTGRARASVLLVVRASVLCATPSTITTAPLPQRLPPRSLGRLGVLCDAQGGRSWHHLRRTCGTPARIFDSIFVRRENAAGHDIVNMNQ